MVILLLIMLEKPCEPVKHILPEHHRSEVRYISEFTFIAVAGIKLYQWTLSGQQGDVCNFQPSCSHFAFRVIKEYGPVLGILMASDRIQRCHPFSWYYVYRIYPVVNTPHRGLKLYDPPEQYRKYFKRR